MEKEFAVVGEILARHVLSGTKNELRQNVQESQDINYAFEQGVSRGKAELAEEIREALKR